MLIVEQEKKVSKYLHVGYIDLSCRKAVNERNLI